MRRRIAITVAALLLIGLMARIPLPGIDMSPLLRSGGRSGGVLGALFEGGAWGRLSIGALNIVPLFSAFFMFELWRTVTGKMYGGDLGGPDRSRVLRGIVVFALLMAAFQAWGIAVALEQMRQLATGRIVLEPGFGFRASTVASMVGATAIMAWLMTLISRDGIGGGLWILFAAATLHQLPASAAQVYELTRNGAISAAIIWLFFGLTAAATALLVAVSYAKDDDGMAFGIDPWPPIMGLYLYYAWLFGTRFLWADDAADFTQTFSRFAPGSWGYVFGFPLIVAAVAVLRTVRFNAQAAAPQPLSRAAPAIAAVVAICVGSALLAVMSDGLILATHTLIPVVVALLAADQRLSMQRLSTDR